MFFIYLKNLDIICMILCVYYFCEIMFIKNKYNILIKNIL